MVYEVANTTPSSDTDDDTGTILEDVLPSFEMHNYMFNRTIFDTENLTSLDQPPNYDASNVRHRASFSSTAESDHIFPPGDLNNYVDPTTNPNLILLNNFDKFQKIALPIHIQIVLTKSIPKVGTKPERENPLRQYKPGETVCGYFLIENKSKEDIPFEMLLVSLEGDLTIPHPSIPEKVIKKKFLTTFDLSACFHYGCIDMKSQNVSIETLKDPLDDTLVGFENDRLIKTGRVHKKIFTFKLPRYLLDNACPDELPLHLELPPSFGIDNSAFNNTTKLIKINPYVGYGRLDRYGSPIKTSDYATDGQSISYYINVQFIGRKLDAYKKYYNTETNLEYDFISLKTSEYYFRVETFKNLESEFQNPYGELSTDQQIKTVEKIATDHLTELLERKNLKQAGVTDPRTQDEIIHSSSGLADKKIAQLSNSNETIPTLKDMKTQSMDNLGFTRTNTLTFVKDFFNKVEGDMKISVSVCKNMQIRSLKPKALKQASKNRQYDSSEQLKPNISSTSLSTLTLAPTMSPALSRDSVINDTDTEKLHVNLVFKPLHLKKHSKVNLPSSLTFTPILRVHNIQSPYPIPISFDNEFIFHGGMEDQQLELLRKSFPSIINKRLMY
ncbi:hypothetical protein CANINC_002275 [Pichia inconspicua]|uniref:Bul1 N-terminal domain-containing protein n=1 Tax=Pichia inconspicua TaxID=52247 RepID=A0A4T0X1W0_9ASCO|nr:hypothetical protein CANINC_002275 [[Candida] inconspicua]